MSKASAKGRVSSAHLCLSAEWDLSCTALFMPLVKEDLPVLCLRYFTSCCLGEGGTKRGRWKTETRKKRCRNGQFHQSAVEICCRGVGTHTHTHTLILCHLKMVNYHSTSPETSTDQTLSYNCGLAGLHTCPKAPFLRDVHTEP